MKNIIIAILIGWILTVYLSILILKNTFYIYNIVFLIILSCAYNISLVIYGFSNEQKNTGKKSKLKINRKK